MKIDVKNHFILIGLTLFLLCQPDFLVSQNFGTDKIDKVLDSLKKVSQEKRRAFYFNLGDSIILKNSPDEATVLFQYLFKKDTTQFAKLIMYETYARNLSRRGNLDEAILLKNKGLQLAEKLKDEERLIFYNISLGYSYDQKNKPDLALECLTKIEDLMQKKENKEQLANFYDVKASIYNSLKDYETQENYLLKIYDLIKDLPNTPKKRFHLYMILEFYTQMEKPEQLAKFTEILSKHYEEAHANIPWATCPLKPYLSEN